MSKIYTAALFAVCLVPFNSFAKCTNESLAVMSPTKFLVYHTDKEHKVITTSKGVNYERTHDEYSDMGYLYEISHKKDLDKKCTLVLKPAAKDFTLKQKSELIVTAASLVNKNFTMTLDHENLSAINCTGVQTLGDLRDVMDPYLSFNCKDSFAYHETKKEGAMRLPASVTSSAKKH